MLTQNHYGRVHLNLDEYNIYIVPLKWNKNKGNNNGNNNNNSQHRRIIGILLRCFFSFVMTLVEETIVLFISLRCLWVRVRVCAPQRNVCIVIENCWFNGRESEWFIGFHFSSLFFVCCYFAEGQWCVKYKT